MAPAPRSSMCGSTAWQVWNMLLTLMAMRRFHCASLVSRNGRTVTVPAWLNRRSMCPHASNAAAIDAADLGADACVGGKEQGVAIGCADVAYGLLRALRVGVEDGDARLRGRGDGPWRGRSRRRLPRPPPPGWRSVSCRISRDGTLRRRAPPSPGWPGAHVPCTMDHRANLWGIVPYSGTKREAEPERAMGLRGHEGDRASGPSSRRASTGTAARVEAPGAGRARGVASPPGARRLEARGSASARGSVGGWIAPPAGGTVRARR